MVGAMRVLATWRWLPLLFLGACQRPCGASTVDGGTTDAARAQRDAAAAVDPQPSLRRALGELIAHCDLGLSLSRPVPVTFGFQVGESGALERLIRADVLVDLPSSCGGWRAYTLPRFLRLSKAATYHLAVDPKAWRSDGIGPLVIGMHADGLRRLGMVPDDQQAWVTFRQDGRERPASVRFDRHWYWPSQATPVIDALVDGAQDRLVGLTMKPPDGAPDATLPPLAPAPLLLGERSDAIESALRVALGPDGSRLHDGQLVDDTGHPVGRYHLDSLCHLRWQRNGDAAWTISPFVAIDGVVYYSEGGRELPNGAQILCTSDRLLIELPTVGEPTAWRSEPDGWRPLPIDCTRSAPHFIDCTSLMRGLPGPYRFVQLGREILPRHPLHDDAAGGVSSSPLARAFASPDREQCEALIDRIWQDLRPSLELFGASPDVSEARFRGARSTREFADTCAHAPAEVRACLSAAPRSDLKAMQNCLLRAPRSSSMPRLPVEREVSAKPAALSREEARAVQKRLVGTWEGERERWSFYPDGRVQTKFGLEVRPYTVAGRGDLRIDNEVGGHFTAHYAFVGEQLLLHERFFERVVDRDRFSVGAPGGTVFYDHGSCAIVDDFGVRRRATCQLELAGAPAAFVVDTTEDGAPRHHRFRVVDDVFVHDFVKPLTRTNATPR